MDKSKKQRNFMAVGLLLLLSIWIISRNNRPVPFQTDNGLIFGTIYQVSYQYPTSLKAEIEEALHQFDHSLSPFNKQSVIYNPQNEALRLDKTKRYVLMYF